jgi:hypothetical protein
MEDMKVDEIPITGVRVDNTSIYSIYLNDELIWERLFTYTLLDDGTYSVEEISILAMGDIVIPSTYNGKAVTAIGKRAFEESNINRVVIPYGVTSIGQYAFRECTFLYGITIPDSVTFIGGAAFYKCKRLSSFTFPNSLTSISGSVLSDCYDLTEVVIPRSVTTIGDAAFHNCTSLTKVYYKGTEAEWSNISIVGTFNSYLKNATRYYYSETQPTTYGNYWHYVDGVPTVWEIAISTYALDVKFARTAYIDPGSGWTTVGDVGDFDVTIPTEISNIETLEIPVWATQAKSGYLKLSLGSYTNANCTLVLTDSANGKYTLTISEATGDVSVTINGTSP